MAKFFAKPRGTNLSSRQWRKVSIILWWPDRDLEDYGDFEKMPRKFRSLVRRCKQSGSRYLAYASVTMPDGSEVYGYSRCMGIDNPTRVFAINKAVGFLRKHMGDEQWLVRHGVKCLDRFEVVRVDEHKS